MELLLNSTDAYRAQKTAEHNPCLMKGGPRAKRFGWGLYFLKAMVRGKISPTAIFDKKALKEKLKGLAAQDMEIFLDAGGGTKPTFIFEGTPASYSNSTNPGLYDFAMMINEVILSDQYHAKEYLKPDSVVIDAGANVGLFSVLAGKLCPQGKVYAFEVANEANRFLKENTKSMPNVVVARTGLGDRNTEIGIDKAFAGPGARVADCGIPPSGDQVIPEKSRIVTLDSFVKENGIPKVDFIKIDTEGYEKQILRGGAETIKKFKPVIAVSAYHFASDIKDIPALIQSIEPAYRYELSEKADEEDLVFHV